MNDKPDVTAQSLYLTSLRPGDSLRCTQSRLRVAAEILGEKMGIVSWPSVRYTHLIAFVNILKARKLSTRTIRVYLAAVRRVLKEAYLQGDIDPVEWARIQEVRPPRAERRPLSGRHISDEEFAALLKAARRPRDRALLLLLRQTGLRRSEAASLTWGAYGAAEGSLDVFGKGGHHRRVYLRGRAKVEVEGLRPEGERSGAIFGALTPWGRDLGRCISPQNVRRIIEDCRVRAGVAPFSSHSFRHTLIGTLLDKGCDLVTVQAVAGHASPTTTSQYDRRGDDRKKSAAALIE